MKVWSEIHPAGGDFAFQPGSRYAVLASVSKNYSLSEVEHAAEGKGFSITYAWEQGDPSRATYAIDAWLASLKPDAIDNHRWIYAEGNFTGSSAWSLSVDPSWPLTLYHVQHVLTAVDAPDPATPGGAPAAPVLPPTEQAAPSGSSSAVLLAVVGVLGAVGGFLLGRRF